MNRKNKTFALALLLLLLTTYATAAEISVTNVTITKGGTAQMEVYLTNTDVECTGFQFLLTLPQGITPAKDTDNAYVLQKGSRVSALALTLGLSDIGNNQYKFMAYQGSGLPVVFPGTEGQILTIKLQADQTLTEGDVLNASLTNIRIADSSAQGHSLTDAPFSITVTEPTYTILDETSTTVPTSTGSEPVAIKVKRTIKAGEWSTICLPFAMTEAQTKAAFGDDVLLYEFVDYDTEEEGDDIIGIVVNFEPTDLAGHGFEANLPYLIKISEASFPTGITEFETTSVIDPDEENAVADYDNGRPKTHSKYHLYASFIGTYHAGDFIPENDLFIANNKFYYSAGKTKIKGFRAYFWLEDVLTVVEDAGIKMRINEAGEATVIEDMSNVKCQMSNDEVFDLVGRRVKNPTRGLYIIDGKKVFKNQ